jgi:hypothetical protein
MSGKGCLAGAFLLLSLPALGSRGPSAPPRASPERTATELIDTAIRNDSGAFEGVVRDLVLDAALGSVLRVVVELPEPSRRTIAVPWSYLAIHESGEIVWRATRDQLAAAPTHGDGESASSEAPPPTAPDEPVTYAPTEEIVERFDPARVAAYRGVVLGTMTASFQGGAEDVVAIVDLEDGRTVHARLGPEVYLTQIGLGIAPGQAVLLAGFALDLGGRPTVVVSEITVLDRRYVLRNLDGTPLWKRRSRAEGVRPAPRARKLPGRRWRNGACE